MNAQKEIQRIKDWLLDYKKTTKCKGVVLGLSGGKDSTVVAMLVKAVWGDNMLCLLMPNGEQKDISDSLAIADALRVPHKIVNIETIYNSLIHVTENSIAEVPKNVFHGKTVYERDYVQNCPRITEKAKTNIPPRIRMTILYAVAQTRGYRVAGTGNLSEAYIGWFTKWGDGAHDFNPIAHLTCSEVIEIGKELAKEYGLDEKYIVKTPADGLSGKSDEENFGFSYAELDRHIRTNPSERVDGTLDGQKIERKHSETAHKRALPLKIAGKPLD